MQAMRAIRGAIDANQEMWVTWFDDGKIYVASSQHEMAILISPGGKWELSDFWGAANADIYVRMDIRWNEERRPRDPLTTLEKKRFEKILNKAEEELMGEEL